MEGTPPPSLNVLDAGRPEPPSRVAQTGTKFPGDVAVPRRSSSPRGPEAPTPPPQSDGDGTSTLALGGCGHDPEANTRQWTDVHLRFRLSATLSFSARSEGPEEDVQQAGDRPSSSLLSSLLLLCSLLLPPRIHASIYTHLRRRDTYTHSLCLCLLSLPTRSSCLAHSAPVFVVSPYGRGYVPGLTGAREPASMGSPSPRGRDSDPCLFLG